MELQELKKVLADAYEDDIEGLCDCLRLTSHDILNMFERRLELHRENFQGFDADPLELFDEGDDETEE